MVLRARSSHCGGPVSPASRPSQEHLVLWVFFSALLPALTQTTFKHRHAPGLHSAPHPGSFLPEAAWLSVFSPCCSLQIYTSIRDTVLGRASSGLDWDPSPISSLHPLRTFWKVCFAFFCFSKFKFLFKVWNIMNTERCIKQTFCSVISHSQKTEPRGRILLAPYSKVVITSIFLMVTT